MEKDIENISNKKIDFSKQGKKNRAAGQRFEAKVRAGLEEMGWVVDKWTNTVDYDREGGTGKVVPAKRKYNPFKKIMVIGTGFPDFIGIRKKEEKVMRDAFENEVTIGENTFEVVGVEVKANGYLDRAERDMCHWLLDNKKFSKILIAKKGKKRGEVEYVDFSEKYKKDAKGEYK